MTTEPDDNKSFLDSVEQYLAEQAPPPRVEPTPPRGRRSITLGATGSGTGYARAALDAETDRVARAAAGTRNHTLNSAAYCLGQLVAGGALDENTVVAELTAAAERAGLDTDPNCGPHGIAATIHSGLSKGKQQPRTAPAPAPETATGAGEPGATDPHDPHGDTSMIDQLRGALVDTTGLDSIPEPVPLVDGILYRDSTAWMIGSPGNGKSFVAVDLAGCVATGEVWQTHPVTQGPVLYLVAEGLSGMRQRVRAWETAMKRPMTGVHFLPVAVQASQVPAWDAFTQLAAELAPALIIVDTQARVTVGSEENSARDMGEFVHQVDQVRQATGACVLVVHHTGRSGTLRGSTALEGAASTIIRTAKDGETITVECGKQKDTVEFDEFCLRLVPSGGSAVLTTIGPTSGRWEMTPAVTRMLRTWWDTHRDDPVSISALEQVGISRTGFYRAKYPLLTQGVILQVGTDKSPRYRLIRPPT